MGKIKLKHGSHEIELEGDDAFVERQLKAFYDRVGTSLASPAVTKITASEVLAAEPTTKPAGPPPTPAEFFRLKSRGKVDGITQLIVFGKYLELYRGQSEFSMKELNAAVKEARLAKDIHGQYFTNAVKQGLLRSLGSGRYSLTLSAEELVPND